MVFMLPLDIEDDGNSSAWRKNGERIDTLHPQLRAQKGNLQRLLDQITHRRDRVASEAQLRAHCGSTPFTNFEPNLSRLVRNRDHWEGWTLEPELGAQF